MAKNDKKKGKKKPKPEKPKKGEATTQGEGDQPPVGPKP